MLLGFFHQPPLSGNFVKCLVKCGWGIDVVVIPSDLGIVIPIDFLIDWFFQHFTFTQRQPCKVELRILYTNFH